MNENKQLTPRNKEELAFKLICYLQKQNMFTMVNIYINNQRWSSDEHVGDKEWETMYGKFYVSDNIDVTKIVEYNNPDTLTMTFEGPLHHALNYSMDKTGNDLRKIFEKYGLYFEQGYAWSLAAYYN